MCVVTHDEHFHNQDFTLLKSNLMFGLGFFFFKSPANPEAGDEGEGQVKRGQTPFLHDPCPTLLLRRQATKNSLSQKSDGTVTEPTMKNKESGGKGMGRMRIQSDAASQQSAHYLRQPGRPMRSHEARMT